MFSNEFVVDGRWLHEIVRSPAPFRTWFTVGVAQIPLTEGQDYKVAETKTNGQTRLDVLFTTFAAQAICAIERSEYSSAAILSLAKICVGKEAAFEQPKEAFVEKEEPKPVEPQVIPEPAYVVTPLIPRQTAIRQNPLRKGTKIISMEDVVNTSETNGLKVLTLKSNVEIVSITEVRAILKWNNTEVNRVFLTARNTAEGYVYGRLLDMDVTDDREYFLEVNQFTKALAKSHNASAKALLEKVTYLPKVEVRKKDGPKPIEVKHVTVLDQTEHIKPHFIQELGCDGLTSQEIATSIGMREDNLSSLIQKLKRLGDLTEVQEIKVSSDGIHKSRIYLVNTDDAKFIVTQSSTAAGRGYCRFLIQCEAAVEKAKEVLDKAKSTFVKALDGESDSSINIEFVRAATEAIKNLTKRVDAMEAGRLPENVSEEPLNNEQIKQITRLLDLIKARSYGDSEEKAKAKSNAMLIIKHKFHESDKRHEEQHYKIPQKHYSACVVLLEDMLRCGAAVGEAVKNWSNSLRNDSKKSV